MNKGCLYNFLGALAVGAIILFGGLYMARKMYQSFRQKIDSNGLVMKAVVIDKLYIKTKHTKFKYLYKDKKYTAMEQGDNIFDTLSLGDTILIKIDTLKPKNAYIISY